MKSLASKVISADQLLFNFWSHFPASWLRPLPVTNGSRKPLEMALKMDN